MSYPCELKEQAAQPTLTIRTTTPVRRLPQVLGQAYGTIAQYLGQMGEQPAGPPFVLYHNMDMQALDIEAGFVVAKKLAGRGEMQAGEIPAGKSDTQTPRERITWTWLGSTTGRTPQGGLSSLGERLG